jgi:hypothetical protein
LDLALARCILFFQHFGNHQAHGLSPTTQRVVGISCMIAAAILQTLNLKRVADLGTYWIAIPLFTIGIILVARSRSRENQV